LPDRNTCRRGTDQGGGENEERKGETFEKKRSQTRAQQFGPTTGCTQGRRRVSTGWKRKKEESKTCPRGRLKK